MAQSVAGTELATTWDADVSSVAFKVSCDWNRDGDYLDTYEDVSDRVRSITIRRKNYTAQMGLPSLGNVPLATAEVYLDNSDNWFSTDNASGLVGTYSDLANGIYRIPIKIETGYVNSAGSDELLTQFVGRIEEPSESERMGEATVTFRCRDAGVMLTEHNVTTDLLLDQRPDEYMSTLLSDAGYTDTDLDQGMSIIPYAWADDEPVWKECQRAAATEGGQFYIGKDGTAIFRRASAWLERADSTSSVATISSGEITRYGDEITARDLYTGVIVGWERRYLAEVQEIYKGPDIYEIEANNFDPGETFNVRYQHPCYEVFAPVNGTDYTAVTSGMREIAEGTSGVEVSSSFHAQSGEVTFKNHTSQRIYIMDFVLRGIPLVADTADQEDYDQTVSPPLIPGTKVYKIRGNPFIQTQTQADILGGFMRDRLQRPRRIFTWTGNACPFLELGDRVHIDHKTTDDNPNIDEDCYVVGDEQTLRLTGGVYEQTLTLLPVSNLFAYDNFFIIGSSEYADTGSDVAGY